MSDSAGENRGVLIDPKELRKIGFNGAVEGDGHKIMVQTEVLGRGHMIIRTVVLDRGVVQSTEEQPCPVTKDIELVRKTAKEQHERILEQQKRGA